MSSYLHKILRLNIFSIIILLQPGVISVAQCCSEMQNFKLKACVAATWKFGAIAASKSGALLASGLSSVDAVEEGIKSVEIDNCDQYCVGVGGFPNSDGIMEFDAAIMDCDSRYGAVLALQNIKHPISVARTVMEKCVHNVLAGDGALKWALSNGYQVDKDVLTPAMKEQWLKRQEESSHDTRIDVESSHDTIGLICLDNSGRLSCGTSTSGWAFKHPGRIGDAPLVGSGLYCDGSVGAAVATGDGEEIMRTCLSFLVVEYMRQGQTPQAACVLGIERLFSIKASQSSRGAGERQHDKLTVGVVAMNRLGVVGAASTLSSTNQHRGKPVFPVACWRSTSTTLSSGVAENLDINFIEAGIDGASF